MLHLFLLIDLSDMWLVLPSISLLIFCFSSCFFVILLFLTQLWLHFFHCLRLLILPLFFIVALFPFTFIWSMANFCALLAHCHSHKSSSTLSPECSSNCSHPGPGYPNPNQWMPPALPLTISLIQLSFHLLPLLPPPLWALIPAPSLPVALIPLLPPLLLALIPLLPRPLLLLLSSTLPILSLAWAQPFTNSPQQPFQMSSFLTFPSFLTSFHLCPPPQLVPPLLPPPALLSPSLPQFPSGWTGCTLSQVKPYESHTHTQAHTHIWNNYINNS